MCPYKDEPDRLVQVGIVVHCGKRDETWGLYERRQFYGMD